jgi:hypothetical protein
MMNQTGYQEESLLMMSLYVQVVFDPIERHHTARFLAAVVYSIHNT